MTFRDSTLEQLAATVPCTVGRIAAALDRRPRGVRLALAGIEPLVQTPDELARGQTVRRWALADLPAAMRQELVRVARQRGYRDAAHLLSDPPARVTPSVPLADVAPHYVERAARLRRALRLALAQRDTLPPGELLRLGLEEYRREFGAVSERHWRRLLRRTIDRDGGAENFHDLALYLDERLTPREEAQKSVVMNAGDRRILDICEGVADRQRPTAHERELIWATVCEELHERVSNGTKEKPARRDVALMLKASAVHLAKNDAGLRDAVKRKYEQWLEGGMSLEAIADQRREKSGWHRKVQILENDRLALIARTRLHCGGRVAQGFRESLETGVLSDDFARNYGAPGASKSYVPRSVRQAITPDVRRLDAIHHGPREHKLRGAFHNRDWSTVAAGDWYQSDDLTQPVYYWKETPRGVELMRGQFLPMVDERTTFILGFVLISQRTYNSLAIRSLITTSCAEHGLPRSGFSFERGIWQSSKIITGGPHAVTHDKVERGLRSLGLSFRHAQLPRGKVIERMLGMLQDMMEGWPGYAGRDERKDKFERVQRHKLDVENGRVAANEYFLSEEEIAAEFERLCATYNEAPQEGRKLDGLSPREGWETLQSAPRVRFDDRALYLLAHERRRVKIGRNGITLQIGRNRFNYKGAETGRRVGETVLAWFNPLRPDVLAVTDQDEAGVFTVERSYDIPAVDCPREVFADEQGKIADHNRYATELYRVIRNTLPAQAFRGNIVDAKTADRGATMDRQRGELETAARQRAKDSDEIQRGAARVGMPTALVQADTDGARRGLELLEEAQRSRRAAPLHHPNEDQ